MPIGGALFEGNSKLWAGPLGVSVIGFKGYDCGKTTADTTLVPDQDVKDINYQQEGTKASDHVRTGIDYLLNATFGEIKTGLLVLLMEGVESINTDVNDDFGRIDRSLYQSMRDTEGGGLKVAAVDENGVASILLPDILAFYEAIPIVNADLINWGADTQRNFPVQFRIKWHLFSTGESTAHTGGFGYWGDPTESDVPALDTTQWPDVEAPILLTGDADLATQLVLTFNENIAFQTAWDATHYVVKVNGDGFVLSTNGVIATTTLTLTFPAATFAASDIIEISISENALEDTAATANEYAGIYGFPCTESI